jgi:hypothetical protein
MKSINDYILGSFIADIERKVREQTNSKMLVSYLGTKSSYLDGNDYPITGKLWPSISVLVSWKN